MQHTASFLGALKLFKRIGVAEVTTGRHQKPQRLGWGSKFRTGRSGFANSSKRYFSSASFDFSSQPSVKWLPAWLIGGTVAATVVSTGFGDQGKAQAEQKEIDDAVEFEAELASIQALLESLMKGNLTGPNFQDLASQLWLTISQKEVTPGVGGVKPPKSVNEAISRLLDMLDEGRERKRLCKPLAIAYILRGQYEQAMPFLIEANWENPYDPELYLHQGHIYMRESNYSEAYENFEKALLLNPSLTIAEGPRNEAMKRLTLSPSNELYWHVQGVIRYDLGLYQESYDCYQKALSLNPKFEDSWYNAKVVKHILDQQAYFHENQIEPIPAKLLPIVTTYEYATMAEAAYTVSAKAFPPKDWKLWLTSGDFCDLNGSLSRDGFFGAVYVNHKKQQIVLALQGSKATNDLISCLHLVLDAFDRQWVCAKLFGELVHKRIALNPELKGYRVSLTGHSLGAAQAEFLSFLHDEPAVTFESPGVHKVLRSIFGEAVASKDPTSYKVRAYMPRPNIINTAKPHVGTLHRIYPPLPPKGIRAENADLLMGTIDSIKKVTDIVSVPGIEKFVGGTLGREILKLLSETELMVLETAHWHSMARICQALRHEYETGIPIKQRTVIQWPATETFYLWWRVARDSLGEPDEADVSELNRQSLMFAHYEVMDRSMHEIPLSEFTRSELRFLNEYNRNPGAFSAQCSELDKKVLNKFTIKYNTVETHVGLSPEHFKDYVKWKAAQVTSSTENSALSFSSLF